MGVSERRFRVSMSEPILPDFDWSAHPVEFCRVAVTESMKPHASSLSDPELLAHNQATVTEVHNAPPHARVFGETEEEAARIAYLMWHGDATQTNGYRWNQSGET
jgi:hypothetical protein